MRPVFFRWTRPSFDKLPLANKFAIPKRRTNRLEAELGQICGAAALDLLKSLLSLDPIQRPSAGSALIASYFRTKPFARHHTLLGQVPTGTSCHMLRTAGLRHLTREGPVTRSERRFMSHVHGNSVGLSVEAPNEEYIEYQTVTMDVGHDRLSDTEEELLLDQSLYDMPAKPLPHSLDGII